MHQTGNEALSALLDGEADELELRRLLKSLDSDSESAEELLRQWQRFHLAQDVLHDRGVPVSDSLLGRINAQLESEEQYASAVAAPQSGWQSTISRLAIAACVAVVAVVALQVDTNPTAPGSMLAGDSQSRDELQPQEELQPTLLAESEQFAVDPAAEARLRLFLEGISIDVAEPIVTEQIKDSPLFRLVNQRQD
jgi:sigma-E factor negative regulatory protein RseA